jgi:hypothetical protein
MIHDSVQRLKMGYRQTYGDLKPEYAELIAQFAAMTLAAIAHTDALYHDVEHTILVTLVGQEILLGKQLQEGTVAPEDWVHFILALLCHDIGYIRGICQQDQPNQQRFTTGVGTGQVAIAPGATDAILTPYHVDRSKRFVAEQFAAYHLLDVKRIQHIIELTRFPIPKDHLHQDTTGYPGLARAADLIGQLADPHYLEKLPALFHEFAETGAHKALGYQHPGDLRLGYPTFFSTVVYPLIQPAICYLQVTQVGRQTLNGLYTNVAIVEQESRKAVQEDRDGENCKQGRMVKGDVREAKGGDRLCDSFLLSNRYHFFLPDNSPLPKPGFPNHQPISSHFSATPKQPVRCP